MKIASWNVNSIKARLPAVIDWLGSAAPDVLALQELKYPDDAFPHAEIEAAGYTATVVGQKTYNGVALISRSPPDDADDVRVSLPGDEADAQARYVEACFSGVRVASIYLPNGNPAPGGKYDYKLAWMRRLAAHAADLLAGEAPVVLCGDYNVIPEARDCHDPEGWRTDALFMPETRAVFREILHAGWTDAFRAMEPDLSGAYTFWDYQGGAWDRGEGIRIDHLLLSPAAADLLERCEIDAAPRGRPRASDHTPIWCSLAPASEDGLF